MDEQTKKALGVSENQPTDWFETLYANSSEAGNGVPWANMSTHPIFKKWLDQNKLDGNGKTALVVGCGMGDDAITLEALGFEVTAFDVAQSAIDLCHKRFPNSSSNFVQEDLLAGIPAWSKKFDFVLEIYTIQALPPKYEQTLIKNLSDLVSDEGKLLLITEVQHQKRDFENGPPWLLNKDYVQSFENQGLELTSQEINEHSEMGDESHLSVFLRKA
jgi:cyclopropane fatty-acyl-phospholipid synthase-like methyltransferase